MEIVLTKIRKKLKGNHQELWPSGKKGSMTGMMWHLTFLKGEEIY